MGGRNVRLLGQFAKASASFLVRHREWTAVRAAARGDHLAAMGPFDRTPVGVASALGLHAAVLSRNARETLDDQVSTALAAAELGSPADALAAVGADTAKLPDRDRRRLALAIGRWTPSVAMSLAPASAHLLNSALALKSGQTDLAARLISDRNAVPGADYSLLQSKIAAVRGDYRMARRAANDAFGAFDLAAPLDQNVDAPIALADFGRTGSGRSPATSDGPLVSVIMPARNAEATISIAIRSVLEQSWRAIELIVVDDGSTDRTAGAIRDAIGSDPRARIICRSLSGGAYAARNDGLAAARGVFITFNDADDWSHPDRIKSDSAALLASPLLVATQSRLVRLSADGQFTAARVFPLVRANPSSLLFRRREVLAALGGFEEVPFGADEEFSARLTACFGAQSLQRNRTLLTVASDSAASLTGSATTGLGSVEGVRARIAYREAWHGRHLETYRALERQQRRDAWHLQRR